VGALCLRRVRQSDLNPMDIIWGTHQASIPRSLSEDPRGSRMTPSVFVPPTSTPIRKYRLVIVTYFDLNRCYLTQVLLFLKGQSMLYPSAKAFRRGQFRPLVTPTPASSGKTNTASPLTGSTDSFRSPFEHAGVFGVIMVPCYLNQDMEDMPMSGAYLCLPLRRSFCLPRSYT
jgi:hypothetical protein